VQNCRVSPDLPPVAAERTMTYRAPGLRSRTPLAGLVSALWSHAQAASWSLRSQVGPAPWPSHGGRAAEQADPAEAPRRTQALIARTIAMEVGSPMSIAAPIQAGLPVAVTSGYAKLLRETKLEHEIGNSLVVREAAGVAGCITPWNYPLHQIMAKVAPALAAGCTVVLKPSEIAPLNAMLLAEAAIAIGLPAGVLNIVTGYGPVVGEAIATHPLIDLVSFTGSVRAGKRVAALAADTVKKVTLELGGKSAFIILDDAPFEKAVPAGARNSMLNSGQTCSAWTRMLVPRARQQDAIDLAMKAVAGLTVGDPLDPATRLGPLISATQRDRVEGYIAKGKQEGAKLVAGGARPAAFSKGYYVEATVFADVKSPMTIAQEEIFGPVLSILPYDSEDEAVEIANDTIYGLAGGVWSGDADHVRVTESGVVPYTVATGAVGMGSGAGPHTAALFRRPTLSSLVVVRTVRYTGPVFVSL